MKHLPIHLAAALIAVTLLPNGAMAAATELTLPHNLSPWGMFMGADIVVKAVMVGLAFASLVTWTVWLAKTLELARERRIARRRLRLLESDTTLAAVEHWVAERSDGGWALVMVDDAHLWDAGVGVDDVRRTTRDRLLGLLGAGWARRNRPAPAVDPTDGPPAQP